MVFTEVKKRNRKRYYYRVISVRDGNKVRKKRTYLGVNLSKEQLLNTEAIADKKMQVTNINKSFRLMAPKIIKILKKYQVEKAGIFGSYARGEQKKYSDIDIIIEPPKKMGIEFITLNYELEDSLKKKVDLITYKGINQRIKKYILNDEVRIL